MTVLEYKLKVEEKEGIPLWKYFIILALLCLAGEILILRLKDQPVS